MLAFLYCLNLKNKVDKVVNNISLFKYHDKCKFASKFIQLATNTNLFAFEVVQKVPNLQTLCATGKLELHDGSRL